MKQVELVRWMVQIAGALRHLNKHSIVHRDLKLENVVLTRKRHAKVIDFGLALENEELEDRQESFIVGTYQYMAPENMDLLPCSHKSDIWALGVMLYTLCQQALPFGSNALEIQEQIHYAQPEPLPKHILPSV